MTCIVGFKTENEVLIGADSMASNGMNCNIRRDFKLFTTKCGKAIVGFTDSYRSGQILKYILDFSSYDLKSDIMDPFDYIVEEIIPLVRNAFKYGGYLKVTDQEESGSTFIVGFHKRLFIIFSDFSVSELLDNYCAIGSGEQYALGSLYTLSCINTIKLPPQTIL